MAINCQFGPKSYYFIGFNFNFRTLIFFLTLYLMSQDKLKMYFAAMKISSPKIDAVHLSGRMRILVHTASFEGGRKIYICSGPIMKFRVEIQLRTRRRLQMAAGV
jgi:hypothetical protein